MKELKEFWKELPWYAKLLIVVAGIAGVLLLLNWLLKKFYSFNPANLPSTDGNGQPLSNADASKVRALANSLLTDMTGLNVLGRNWQAYKELNELPDPLFVAVYNDFGNLSFSKGKGTLRQWIQDENFTASAFFTTPLWWLQGNIKDSILSRMDLLNLQ